MIDLTEFVIEKLSAIPGVTVRASYDTSVPEYPLITVSQIDNYEVLQYTTIDLIETGSAVPIQLDCYARNMVIDGIPTTAAKSAEQYRIMADAIMQRECGMRRTSSPLVLPHSTDSTVMRAISRYDCVVDLVREIIYKR